VLGQVEIDGDGHLVTQDLGFALVVDPILVENAHNLLLQTGRVLESPSAGAIKGKVVAIARGGGFEAQAAKGAHVLDLRAASTGPALVLASVRALLAGLATAAAHFGGQIARHLATCFFLRRRRLPARTARW